MKKILMKVALLCGLLTASLTCMADAVKPAMSDLDFFVRVTPKAKSKALIEFEVCLPTPRMLEASCSEDLGPETDVSPYCEPLVSHDRRFYDKSKLKALSATLKNIAIGRLGLLTFIVPVVGAFADAPKQYLYSLGSQVLSDALLNDKEVLVRQDDHLFSVEEIKAKKKRGEVFLSMEEYADALKFALAHYNEKYPKVAPAER